LVYIALIPCRKNVLVILRKCHRGTIPIHFQIKHQLFSLLTHNQDIALILYHKSKVVRPSAGRNIHLGQIFGSLRVAQNIGNLLQLVAFHVEVIEVLSISREQNLLTSENEL
jgi:hypothetical protein